MLARAAWRIGRIGAALLLFVVVATGVLFATSWGQRGLLQYAAWQASDSSMQVRIGQLSGSLLSEGEIDRIEFLELPGRVAQP